MFGKLFEGDEEVHVVIENSLAFKSIINLVCILNGVNPLVLFQKFNLVESFPIGLALHRHSPKPPLHPIFDAL